MPNLLEGGNRIAAGGRMLLKIGAGFAVAALSIFALALIGLLQGVHGYTFSYTWQPIALLLGVCAFWLVLVGAALRFAGWVVTGFGKDI